MALCKISASDRVLWTLLVYCPRPLVWGGCHPELYRFFSFPVLRYEAGWGIVIGAILISGGSALLGALMAVRKAVLLPPAEAMRPEPPARFIRLPCWKSWAFSDSSRPWGGLCYAISNGNRSKPL